MKPKSQQFNTCNASSAELSGTAEKVGSCSWHQCFQPKLSPDIANRPRGKDTSG